MDQMIGGLAKRVARAAIVAVLLASGLGVGGALGGGLVYVPVVAQEGEGGGGEGGCENDHCGRIDVNWWFDRDACLDNGDEETGCDATDQHGNCDDTDCNN